MEKEKLEQIVLYTTPTCGKCMQIKKELDTKKIDYSTMIVGIGIKIQDFVEKFGVQYVPVLVTPDNVYTNFVDMKNYVKQLPDKNE